jgi:hypothetical protein
MSVSAPFEGLKNLANAAAAVAIPIVVALLGSYYTAAIKEREVGAKFVELAVQILSKEPTKAEGDAGIRTWATKVLDQYSGVQFDTKTRDDIVKHVPLARIVDTPLQGGSRQLQVPRQINRIIVLDTQENDLKAELEGLTQGRVAYHYLVAKNGDIHRLKDENDVAYHTARFNEDSIGIGILHVTGNDYTQQQVESLSDLVANIVKRRSIPRSNVFAASEISQTKKSDFGKIKEGVLARAFAQGR